MDASIGLSRRCAKSVSDCLAKRSITEAAGSMTSERDDMIAFMRLWRRIGKIVWFYFRQSSRVDSHEKGKRWEGDFAQECQKRGLHIAGGTGREDMLVNGLKVQCKAIDRVTGRGWVDIANMRPVKSNGGRRGYLRVEVDVVALRTRGRVFLIPADHINAHDGMLSPRVLIDDISAFENGWGVFASSYKPPKRDRQISFLVT